MVTTTGEGVGMTTRTCRDGKPKTFYYNINGDYYARFDASRLSDFRTDEGLYEPEQGEIE